MTKLLVRTYESGHVNGLVPALQYLPVCQQLGYVVNTSNFDNIYLRSRANSTLKGPGPASVGTESRSDSYYRVYTGRSINLFEYSFFCLSRTNASVAWLLVAMHVVIVRIKVCLISCHYWLVAMPDWFQVPLLGNFLTCGQERISEVTIYG